MASNRKRINLSVKPKDYQELEQIRRIHGFKNLCQLLLAAAHLLTDRIKASDERLCDVPEDEDEYLDGMFDELGNCERTPDGTVPVRHLNCHVYGED